MSQPKRLLNCQAIANLLTVAKQKIWFSEEALTLIRVLAVGGAIALVGVLGLKVFQDWQTLQQSPSEINQRSFNASLEIGKLVATIAGGIVLYLNFRVATRNAEIANRNAEIAANNLKLAETRLEQDTEKARKDAEIAESRLITDRFSKAVEQLGSDKTEVRLGSIYALERIAKDSGKDHWIIMEVLSAYVREKSPVETQQETTKDENVCEENIADNGSRDTQKDIKKLPIDIQASLTVIKRRKVEQDPKGAVIDLSHTNLQGLLLAKITLQEANLVGTDLRASDLSEATLTAANLDNADLQGADLYGAILPRVSLNDAKLQAVRLVDANLSMAHLVRADLSSAALHRVNLSEAQLNAANLQRVNLTGANLQRANLNESDLQEAQLSQTNLQNAYFNDAKFQKAILIEAKLQGAQLYGANLQEARLSDANLQGADLYAAGLKWARLDDANLQNANLETANLQGAKLLRTDLSTATGWTDEQLSQALLCKTILPQGSKLDPDRDCAAMERTHLISPNPPSLQTPTKSRPE